MRIVYVHKRFSPGGFSISTLFSAIGKEISDMGIDVTHYELTGNLFRDVVALRKIKADIYHITGDVNYMVLPLPWKKTVLTVHDMGHYRFRLKGLKKFIYKWIWFTIPLRIAQQVTAISESTKSELIKFTGMKAGKITVIQNCYSQIFVESPKVFNSGNPRILQIGTSYHKNVISVVRSLQGLSCTIVLVGRIGSELMRELKANDAHFENLIDVDQAKIYEEYLNSDIVSFVSLTEGFGIPIIESQVVGRALITSNISPMANISGAGAYLADPFDIEDIRRGFDTIINDSQFRDRIIAEGLRNVRNYCPARVANLYVEIYTKQIYFLKNW
jgi:glycosyltransferase involved in cell wall biosynthesis